MENPKEYLYSKEHTWLKLLEDNQALIGITAFAQSELGEIVYVDLPSSGSNFSKDEVFGSVEAIKTTSDLFMPISGEVLEINKKVVTNPELVNDDPFEGGWMLKIKMEDITQTELLMNATGYEMLIHPA